MDTTRKSETQNLSFSLMKDNDTFQNVSMKGNDSHQIALTHLEIVQSKPVK